MAGLSRSNPYASLGTVDSGQVTPTTTLTAFPDKPCKLAKFKADSANTGRISIGKKVGLIAGKNANGGFLLSAREETGWFPIQNINLLGVIAENGTDAVQWIILY